MYKYYTAPKSYSEIVEGFGAVLLEVLGGN